MNVHKGRIHQGLCRGLPRLEGGGYQGLIAIMDRPQVESAFEAWAAAAAVWLDVQGCHDPTPAYW
jgi:hypothetical protein